MKLENKYKFKNQTVFTARFDKQDDEDQMPDDFELKINFSSNENLTQSGIDNIHIRYQSKKKRLQSQEMKDSG